MVGFPSSLGFGVGGQPYSNFLASSVTQLPYDLLHNLVMVI